MKALVTGGTGFVGSHVVRALNEAGHSVRVLHRASSKREALDGLQYESALGDIMNEAELAAACAGCDWVFHVAAVADYWREDLSILFETNVEGTRRVLKAAKEAGVKRVVFTSSSATVGQPKPNELADEHLGFNLSPEEFPYGYSKVLAEAVVKEAVEAGQDVVIVNPVIVMGPSDLNMISGSFITEVRWLSWLVPVTPGALAVIDVRDVARMQLAAAERGRTGERYILMTANYSYYEWLGLVAEVVGVQRPFIRVPGWVLPIGGALIDLARGFGIHTPIDSNQMRLGGKKMNLDGRKAWRELGEPQITMRQSIRDAYEWFMAHKYV